MNDAPNDYIRNYYHEIEAAWYVERVTAASREPLTAVADCHRQRILKKILAYGKASVIAVGLAKAHNIPAFEMLEGKPASLWEPGECPSCGLTRPADQFLDPQAHDIGGERICAECHALILDADPDLPCRGCRPRSEP